jgi:hypothetical protein
MDVGNDEGECADGPFDSVCSREPFRSCSDDLDCLPPPVGFCEGCAPEQICTSNPLECFPGSEALGGSVQVHGNAQTPCGATAKQTLGALFCVPPVDSSIANIVTGGVPGLGRIKTPAVMRLLP